ncbi:hypothetical protein F4820DRAFT_451511 [Hypoxylon rubiginosum]|uniref:Uncharacterized protein n=1 Tax=Hypoxylon rubiginosum TaxID=110542 RepID=A0ACB9YS05_9PEZI|nr:hypothetical protein F4820DRAFT_451511 [Hypoxylon rubiginosum]
MPPTLRERLGRTAIQWDKANWDESENDTREAAIAALTTPDFVVPMSLDIPDRGRDEHTAFQSRYLGEFDVFTASLCDMAIDETKRSVISCGYAYGEKAGRSYHVEYMHKLILTDDGLMVKVLDVFKIKEYES